MIDNPVPWPDGKKVAVAITFDVDVDSILHTDHGDRAHRKVATHSMLRYDRIAVKRICDMYRRFGIRQTFFVPAWCMEQHPDIVETILQDGHEIAHHGYIHESPNAQESREDERYWLEKGIEIIEQMTGAKPRGWRAPLYHFSEFSADLLIDAGFLYDASLMGDDVPYMIRTGNGEMIELPSHWGMDDWNHYAHISDMGSEVPTKAPDDAMRVFMSEFEAHRKYGGLWVAVWHPTVSGRLARCDRISQMIEDMMETGDAWFATMEEIAVHIAKCRADGTFTPRVENLSYLTEPLPASVMTPDPS